MNRTIMPTPANLVHALAGGGPTVADVARAALAAHPPDPRVVEYVHAASALLAGALTPLGPARARCLRAWLNGMGLQ